MRIAITLICACLAVAVSAASPPSFPPQFSFFIEEFTTRTDVIWDDNNDRVAIWAEEFRSKDEVLTHIEQHFFGAGYTVHAENATINGKTKLDCCHDNDTKETIGSFWTATNQSSLTECGGLKNLVCWNGKTSGIDKIPFATWCFSSAGEPMCTFFGKDDILVHAFAVGAPQEYFELSSSFGTCSSC